MTNNDYFEHASFDEILNFICDFSCCSCCPNKNKKCESCKKKRRKKVFLISNINGTNKTFEQYFRESNSKLKAHLISHFSFCAGCSKCTPFEEHSECFYYAFVCGIENLLNKERTIEKPLL